MVLYIVCFLVARLLQSAVPREFSSEPVDSDFELDLKALMEKEIFTEGVSLLHLHMNSSSEADPSSETIKKYRAYTPESADELPKDPLSFLRECRKLKPEPVYPLSSYVSEKTRSRHVAERLQTADIFKRGRKAMHSPSPTLTPTCLKQMGLVGDPKKHTKWICNYIFYRHMMSAYDITKPQDADIDLLSLPPHVKGYGLTDCCKLRPEDCRCDSMADGESPEAHALMDTSTPLTTVDPQAGVEEYLPPPSERYLNETDALYPEDNYQPNAYSTDDEEFADAQNPPVHSTPVQTPHKGEHVQTPRKCIHKQLKLKLTPIKPNKRRIDISSDDSDFMPIKKRKKTKKRVIEPWEQPVKPKVSLRAYNQGEDIPKAKPPPDTLAEDMVLLPGIHNEIATLTDLQGLIPQCFKYQSVPADGNCLWHSIAMATQLTNPTKWEDVKLKIIQHHTECYRHTSQKTHDAAQEKAIYLSPSCTWGDEFDLECFSHSTGHVAYCHNRDANHWMVHNPAGVDPIFITYSNMHFGALWPVTPRVDIKWIQKILREMVINPPKEWPTLEPRNTLMKYRPVKPVAQVSPRGKTGKLIVPLQQVDLSGTIKWPHGENKILDTIASAEVQALQTSLKIVNVTLRRYFQHNQEDVDIRVAYGLNLTTLGGTLGTIEYLKRCVFIKTRKDPTLQTTQLYQYIAKRHHIKVHQVTALTPEAVKASLATPYPEFSLQHLYQCATDEDIKIKFGTSRQPFERVKIDSLGFTEEWMYLCKNPGAELVLKCAEVTHRTPGTPMDYFPTTWHYLVDQWAKTKLDPMESLLNGTLDPNKYTTEKLPPMIPFYAKSVTDDVLSMYQGDLETQLKQMNPIQLHQEYREPYSIKASAMLYKAMAEGDSALHNTLGPIIPHMSFNIDDVGEWTARGIPTILAPTPLAEVTKDLILYTSRPQGSMKASPCTRAFNPLLETAITRVLSDHPGLEFCCPFITITQPTTMSILETWCRAFISQYKQQEAFESMMSAIGAIPIHCTSVIEAHYGNRDTPLEAQQKEDIKSKSDADPDTVSTQQRKAEPIPAFQAAAEHMAKGEQITSRKSCSGAAHVHISWCFVCEPAKVPNVTSYIQYFAKWTHPTHVKVQMCVRQYKEKSKKTSNAQPDTRMVHVPNATGQLSYCCKDATHKRAWRALQTLGSPHAFATCKISIYNPYLSPLAAQAKKHSLPVWIQLCCPVVNQPDIHHITDSLTAVDQKTAAKITAQRRLMKAIEDGTGRDGKKYACPIRCLAEQKWKQRDPKAFSLTPQHAANVYVDLTVLNQSVTSSVSPSPPPRQPMLALQALVVWLRNRMTLEQATQLTVHLSTYTLRRQKKAQQIYIEAEPDAGKTTLYNLLERAFATRCFSVSAESKSFMAAAFDEKRKDAVWLEDEFNGHLFWAFDQKHFNKIVEGDLSSFVAFKNKAQKKVKYKGFTILMGNYQLQEITTEEKSQVRFREAESRFYQYKMRKPSKLKKISGYRICNPQALYEDLSDIARDIPNLSEDLMDISQVSNSQISAEGVYTYARDAQPRPTPKQPNAQQTLRF